MTSIDVTKLSSKGQIVIPKEMREGFKEGEKFVIIKAGKQLILKSVEYFEENLEEDLEFAKKTEEAWKKYDKGEFVEMEFDEFIEDMKKW